MLLVDGSIGYGQVLRTSIALSSLTLQPIKIINIRKGRPKPGLLAQHLAGIKVAGEFCNAKIKGLYVGSTEVEFYPKSHNFQQKKFINIGTAGSISLLLQTITPILIFSDKNIEIEIKGGTAGLGAPTIEFTKHVKFPILSKLGVQIPDIEVKKQGFYPKGNGLVRVNFFQGSKLKGVELLDRGSMKSIKGISVAGSLPEEISYRQANGAKNVLLKNYDVNLEIIPKTEKTLSKGTSITLWAEFENSILGADKIGKKGISAEKIGGECAQELIESIESNAALDKYMSDQIIPFLALAKGKSKIKVESLTEHCRTNIKVCEQILGVKFEIDEDKKLIEVEGIGY